jgi:hypothetical protein
VRSDESPIDNGAPAAPPAELMRVRIQVRPGAAKTRVGGSHADALIVRVRQRPVDGAATVAALAALAESLDLPIRDVELVSGHTSRIKIVELPDDAADAFAQLRDTVI